MSLGALLLSLHVLGAMAWVGGTFFLLVVLAPGLASLEPPARTALTDQVLRQFVRIIWHVWPVMLATGLAMNLLFYGSILSTVWPLQAMTGTGTAMAAIFLATVLGPWSDLKRSLANGDTEKTNVALQRVRTLLSVNFALGVATTIFAMLDY